MVFWISLFPQFVSPVKLVIDANIGLKALLRHADSAKASQLRDDFRRGIHQLLAPELYLLEIGNVLVQEARSGAITQAELPAVYADFIKHLPVIHNSSSFFHRAYSIALTVPVSMYHATYLALAEQENCPLLTADMKLAKAATGFQILPFDAF